MPIFISFPLLLPSPRSAAMTGCISGSYLGYSNLEAEYLCKAVSDKGTWEYDELCQLAQSCFNNTKRGKERGRVDNKEEPTTNNNNTVDVNTTTANKELTVDHTPT